MIAFILGWILTPILVITAYTGSGYLFYNGTIINSVYTESTAVLVIAVTTFIIGTFLSSGNDGNVWKKFIMAWNVIPLLLLVNGIYLGICAQRLDTISREKPYTFRVKNSRYYEQACRIMNIKKKDLDYRSETLKEAKLALQNADDYTKLSGYVIDVPQSEIDSHNGDLKKVINEWRRFKKRSLQLQKMKKAYDRETKSTYKRFRFFDEKIKEIF